MEVLCYLLNMPSMINNSVGLSMFSHHRPIIIFSRIIGNIMNETETKDMKHSTEVEGKRKKRKNSIKFMM